MKHYEVNKESISKEALEHLSLIGYGTQKDSLENIEKPRPIQIVINANEESTVDNTILQNVAAARSTNTIGSGSGGSGGHSSNQFE